LWDVLQRPELEQLAQRISYDYFLGPLDSADLVGQYIRHRLAGAGGDPTLFHEDTYPLIWQATGGVPRLINLVCDTALVYGYAEQVPRIELRLVEQVLKDKEMGFAPLNRRAVPSESEVAARVPPMPLTRPQTLPTRSTIERAMRKVNDAAK
jgi:general secretion pathway protein A